MVAQRSVTAPFLMKTYQLVDDQSTDDVISWNQDGTAFVVWKTADFARDLLPNYFKHNNFSSFIRQLNTYGFRKVVPDKWEFANDNFRRGKKELLYEIRRRKTVAPLSPAAGKAAAGPSLQSHSGEDLGSASTSSPESKNPVSATTHVADLSTQNEKLRRSNKMLSSELSAAKKQCEELVRFLTEHLKVCPDEIDRIVGRRRTDGSLESGGGDDDHDDDDDEKVNDKGVGGNLKLFGVWLKDEKKKRGREENVVLGVPHAMKTMEFHAPLLKISKVCN